MARQNIERKEKSEQECEVNTYVILADRRFRHDLSRAILSPLPSTLRRDVTVVCASFRFSVVAVCVSLLHLQNTNALYLFNKEIQRLESFTFPVSASGTSCSSPPAMKSECSQMR